MNLFKLFGTIAINNRDAIEGIDETTQAGENAKSKLSTAFEKIGSAAVKCGKVIATGLAVGAAAFGTLTVKAMNMAGELEQNMGGSEAVFGKYAKSMQKTAEKAYSSMGLSASDYLATANKMGSLFKGAGFEAEEALSLTSEAMQRAADVASIMGIDVSVAMESVAGAAKGNFTMMDNLGVAMNDTNLQAYALSKGIEKSTAEMTSQEKIGLAMQMFLEKTADYAGNYAKENDTLAGSLTTAKAALSNFLSGAGDASTLGDALLGTGKVISEKLKELLPQLVTGCSNLINMLLPELPALIQEVLPALIDGATVLFEGLLSALPDAISVIFGAAEPLTGAFQTIIEKLCSALPGLVEIICAELPALLEQISLALIEILPQIIGMISSVISILCENFDSLTEPIREFAPLVIMTVVDALMANLDILISAVTILIEEILKQTPEIMMQVNDLIPKIFSSILAGVISALPTILSSLGTIISSTFSYLWEMTGPFLANIFSNIGEILSELWEQVLEPIVTWFYDNVIVPIGEFFSGLWDDIVNIFQTAAAWFDEKVIQPIVNFFSPIVETIGNIFSTLWSIVRGVWIVVSTWFNENVIQPVVGFFKSLWDDIVAVFTVVATWFDENVIQPLVSKFKSVWEDVSGFFTSLWADIKGVFETVATWFDENVTQPVIDFFKGVWEDVSGFFTNLWDDITGLFTDLASWFDENVVAPIVEFFNGMLNGIIGGINWVIGGLNKLPDVHINRIATVGTIPEMERGGVLERGQIGFLEGNGAEAVVPLDQNKAWISEVAKDMNTAMGNGSTAQLQEIKELLANFVAVLPDMMMDAFASMKFGVNGREFARMVKAVG